MDQRNLEREQANGVNGQQQPSANERPPQIFKLNVDYFEKVFEYLSIRDLHSFGQTCTRMQKVAGYYYKEEFSKDLFHHDSEFDGFREYVEYMGTGKEGVDWNKFKSVKKIYFDVLCTTFIEKIPKEILNKIEEIECNFCTPQFFEDVLVHFPNLKSFNFGFSANDDDWLTRKYPKLEHVSWISLTGEGKSAGKLQTFFEKNPTIRSFEMDPMTICSMGTSMAKAKLDDLYVDLFQSHLDRIPVETFRTVTQFLYDKGAFKRIHLTIHANKCSIGEYTKWKSPFSLSTVHTKGIDLSPLVHLGELGFPQFQSAHKDFVNMINNPALSKGLENLKKLYFWEAHIDNILPFLHLSPKLEKIIVEHEILKKPVFIDPVALNRERKKLSEQLASKGINVSKVTFFIPESNYLETKWKTVDTNFKFIEIRRCPGEIL
ncbi:uncharacterized protein LOC129578639 [Sitodiplosis mosellana]|uniref:uncharacterized protein LOC129578639 n=1 Tax=Sitodiplosis mosellana TaxID=263140 RepID=UPI0024448DB9|nr:uncharacterized protein LOC129578639 [Sitodiplosis mosellana]